MILAFSHVPKAGGTTLIHQLRSHFGWRHLDVIYRGRRADLIKVYERQDLERDLRICPFLASIAGHSLTPAEDFGRYESQLSWFSFVREPKSRSFSQYLQDLKLEAVSEATTFRQWSNEKLLGGRNRNAQVKQFAGVECAETAIAVIEQKKIFVGITEQYDDSLRLWSQVRDIRGLPIGYESPRNVRSSSNARREFAAREPDLEAQLEEHNREDLKLYDYVVNQWWPRALSAAGGEEALAKAPWTQANGWVPWLKLGENRLYRNAIYKPYARFTSRISS